MYVTSFKDAFSHVIASETYQQMLRPAFGTTRHRRLESEVFFVNLDDDGGSMTVRRVLTVDGAPVPSTEGRIEAALSAPPVESRRALRILADEGARYNLGDLTRNISDPTLALMFAGEAYRARFRFSEDGHESLDDVPVTRIGFRERQRPTIVRDRQGRDLPVSGVLLVGDDGRVWRTELELGSGATAATLRVRYEHDQRLEMLVPQALEESYWYRDARGVRTQITGKASYSNYRRFETSGRVISPIQ